MSPASSLRRSSSFSKAFVYEPHLLSLDLIVYLHLQVLLFVCLPTQVSISIFHHPSPMAWGSLSITISFCFVFMPSSVSLSALTGLLLSHVFLHLGYLLPSSPSFLSLCPTLPSPNPFSVSLFEAFLPYRQRPLVNSARVTASEKHVLFTDPLPLSNLILFFALPPTRTHCLGASAKQKENKQERKTNKFISVFRRPNMQKNLCSFFYIHPFCTNVPARFVV